MQVPSLGVNYWKLNFGLRAQLEGSEFWGSLAFDLVDLLWFQAPPWRLRPIFGLFRHQFDVNLLCRGQIRHYFDMIWNKFSMCLFNLFPTLT